MIFFLLIYIRWRFITQKVRAVIRATTTEALVCKFLCRFSYPWKCHFFFSQHKKVFSSPKLHAIMLNLHFCLSSLSWSIREKHKISSNIHSCWVESSSHSKQMNHQTSKQSSRNCILFQSLEIKRDSLNGEMKSDLLLSAFWAFEHYGHHVLFSVLGKKV